MGGEQHGDPLLDGDAVQQRDDLLALTQVEVGQAARRAAAAGAGDQGVRDENPLLLSARQRPDPGVGEPLGVDRAQHLVDSWPGAGDGIGIPKRCPSSPSATRSRARMGMSGSSSDLLGDIPDRAVPELAGWPPETRTRPAVGSLAGRG